MIKLYTLYSRISFLVLFIILILAVFLLYFSFSSYNTLYDEVEQVINKNYAETIAKEIEPIIDYQMSKESIEEAIHYMMVVNPMVEIYILDKEGNIKNYFIHDNSKLQKNRIDITPLENFINNKKMLPILGEDPRSLKSLKPFSASKFKVGNNESYIYVILRGENYDNSVKDLSSTYFIISGVRIFLIALFLAMFTGLFIFFNFSRRFKELNKKIKEFKNGNYNARVKLKGDDEITLLGNNFNEMADAIDFYEKEKQDLITNISHDLRTPLTAIRGNLEMLIQKESNSYLETSIKNLIKLQNLVDKLFELSKLESRDSEPLFEEFSLGELTQDVVLKTKPLYQTKQIEVNLIEPQISTIIKGNISLIERTIYNILDNAITYSPDNSKITITLYKSLNFITLSVKDQGFGIPEKDQPNIFNRFYRSDNENTRKKNGSGLGLSIVRKIVDIHNGKIEVFSSPNRGTDFIIYLPLI